MVTDRIEGFMYGICAGFIIANILKVAPFSHVASSQGVGDVYAHHPGATRPMQSDEVSAQKAGVGAQRTAKKA